MGRGPILGLTIPALWVPSAPPRPNSGWWAGRWLVPLAFENFPELPCTLSLLPTWL